MAINAQLKAYVLARAQERSTWLGVLGALGAAGWHVPDATVQAIATVLVAIAAALATLLPDQVTKQ